MDTMFGSIFIVFLASTYGGMIQSTYHPDTAGNFEWPRSYPDWSLMQYSDPNSQGQMEVNVAQANIGGMVSVPLANTQATAQEFQPLDGKENDYKPDHPQRDKLLHHVIFNEVKDGLKNEQNVQEETSEKESLTTWKSLEEEQHSELGRDYGAFIPWMPIIVKGKEDKRKIDQASKSAAEDVAMLENLEEPSALYKIENIEREQLIDFLKLPFPAKKESSFVPTLHIADQINETALEETDKVTKSLPYADAEEALALLVSKNNIAALTPSDVSAELVKPYVGPLATPYVLPSGFLADTDEVFATRQNHLKALAEAEAAAAIWNSTRHFGIYH